MTWMTSFNTLLLSYNRVAFRSPFQTLLIPLTLILLLGLSLSRLEQDTAFESFFDHQSALYQPFTDFRHTFGRDDYYLVMVDTDDPYQNNFLTGLKHLHQELTRIPTVASVDSLVNARFILAENDELIISELLETLPSDLHEFQKLREHIQNNPAYHKRLISDDHQTVAILITAMPYKMETAANGDQVQADLIPNDLAAIVKNIHAVIDNNNDFSTGIRLTGSAIVGAELNQAAQQDFIVFTTASILLMIVFLIVMFRRVSGIILPLIIIGSGLVFTLGMMAILGYPLQVTTAILPSFLLVVCVGNSVHMLSDFYRRFDSGQTKKEAMTEAIHHAGIPMLLTSITTSAGLISFAFTDLIPVASLGLFGAIGTLVAFLFTLLLLPPLVAISSIKRRRITASHRVNPSRQEQKDTIQKVLGIIAHLVQRFPGSIVVISALFFIAGIVAATQLSFSNDSMKWSDQDVDVRQSNVAAETALAGSVPVEIIIDTGRSGGALDPEIWLKIDHFFSRLAGNNVNDIPIGSVTSLADIIKETNRGMHNNQASFYTIPTSPELFAQELLLVELNQAHELYQFMDTDQRKIRVTAMIPWIDSIKFPAFVDALKQQYYQQVGTEYPITVTGLGVTLGQFFTHMTSEIISSYLLAGIIITLLTIVLLGDIKLGLLSMLPNLLPIASLLSIMCLFDFPLDMFTLLIGAIAIGLSVDGTVHFMYGYKKQIHIHPHVDKAIEATILTTGRALLITCFVLCGGFLTYALSSLNNLIDFGILTASCTLIAIFSDLFLAPSLMILFFKRNTHSEKPTSL